MNSKRFVHWPGALVFGWMGRRVLAQDRAVEPERRQKCLESTANRYHQADEQRQHRPWRTEPLVRIQRILDLLT